MNEEYKAYSEKLSPSKIKNKEFRKQLRGYSPQEVIPFLDKVASTWSEVQKNELFLISKIESLQKIIEGWEQRAGEIDELKDEAKREASEIVQKSNEQAERIRNQTESWLESSLERMDAAERKRKSILEDIQKRLDQFSGWLSKEVHHNQEFSPPSKEDSSPKSH